MYSVQLLSADKEQRKGGLMKIHYGIADHNGIFGFTWCGYKTNNVLENFTTENKDKVNCKLCLFQIDWDEQNEKDYQEMMDEAHAKMEKELG